MGNGGDDTENEKVQTGSWLHLVYDREGREKDRCICLIEEIP